MTFNEQFAEALAFVTEHASPRLDLIKRGVVVPEHPDKFEDMLMPFHFLSTEQFITTRNVLDMMALELAKSWANPVHVVFEVEEPYDAFQRGCLDDVMDDQR